MTNRRLTTDELQKANAVLKDIRAQLLLLAGEESDLLFAYRRKIAKELIYDERGKPISTAYAANIFAPERRFVMLR